MKDLRELLTASRRFIDRSDREWIVTIIDDRYKYVSNNCYCDCDFEHLHDVRKGFNEELKDSNNILEYDVMKIIDKEGRVIWERGKCKKESEKEFKKIKTLELNKNPIEKLILGSNFEFLSDFKKAKECIYLEVSGQFIALSFSEWDLLNQYVEKLREFK